MVMHDSNKLFRKERGYNGFKRNQKNITIKTKLSTLKKQWDNHNRNEI